MGSYKLSNSGGFSATGDFSNAVALNPTPSQEYLHLLSPSKRGHAEHEPNMLSSLETSRDRTTRENTRANRFGKGVKKGDEIVVEDEKDVQSEANKARSSLTFDSETLELKLNLSQMDSDYEEEKDEGERNSSTNYSENFESDAFSPTANPSFNTEMFSPRSKSNTGEYNSALAMFSPPGSYQKSE